MSPNPAPDVLIVGAGIVGAACARECVRAGLTVAVVEAGVVGGGATAAGMGHLVAMDDSEAQFALTRYSQELWRELAAELPADCEAWTCGTLWVAADAEEMGEVDRKLRFYRERRVPAEVLDERALYQAEPELRPGLAGGLRVPEDGIVYPPSVARHLLEGIPLIRGRVTALEARGVTLADGSKRAAGAVVNATGHWAPELNPGLAVRKRKGHLAITDRYPGFVRHQLVELGYLKSAHSATADSVAFNIQPRTTGQLLIGSSRQFGAEDGAVEPAMLGRMLARAAEYLPGLGRLSVLRTWTGFRAATPDHLPLIGLHEESGIWLATGHEGLGITTSLGTARLLVDGMTGQVSSIPREAYEPERYRRSIVSTAE